MLRFAQPRLVKMASIGAKAKVMQAKSAQETTEEKKVGKGFLMVLLSALSVSAA